MKIRPPFARLGAGFMGFLLLGGTVFSAPPSPVSLSIDTAVTTFLADQKIPGLSLAVVETPYITRVDGYGFSDTGRRLLSSSNTMFQIGEIGEAFTAVAVLQLVEQGKVKLDDPIEQHVPLTPDAWHGITVQQLLQHQSGLPDYTKVASGTSAAPGASFQAVSGIKPAFAPGTETAPSATDYLLLQLLIENASDQSYEAYVRANQLDRLGLKHTFFAGELANLPRELPAGGEPHQRYLKEPALINPTEPATGYRPDPAKPELVALPGDQPLARGTLYASAEDLGAWSLALAGEILIKNPDLRKLIESPAKLKNGGTVSTSGPWFFPGQAGELIARGQGNGFSALLCRFTASKTPLGLVLLANKDGVDLTPLAGQIAETYDSKLKAPVAIQPGASPAAPGGFSPISKPSLGTEKK